MPRRPVAGSKGRIIPFGYCYRECFFSAVSQYLNLSGLADGNTCNPFCQVPAGLNLLSINFKNNIPRFDAGLFGRIALEHLCHQYAAFVLDTVVIGHLLGNILNTHAEASPGSLPHPL